MPAREHDRAGTWRRQCPTATGRHRAGVHVFSLRRLAVLADAPPALLEALCAVEDPDTRLVAAAHPNASDRARRIALARAGHTGQQPAHPVLVARTLIGDDAPTGVHAGPHLPTVILAALDHPGPDGWTWLSWWGRVLADDTVPRHLRVAAARRRVADQDSLDADTREDILILVAGHPGDAARVLDVASDHTLRRLLAGATNPRPVTATDRALVLGSHDVARATLLAAGGAAGAVATDLLAARGTRPAVHAAIALTPTVAETVRADAVRQLRGEALLLTVHTVARTGGTDLICAAATRTRENPFTLARGHRRRVLPPGLANAALNTPGLDRADLLALAVHPDATPGERAAARQRLGSPGAAEQVLLDAADHLPDLAAAGRALPWPAVGHVPALARCVQAALAPIAQAATTPERARVLVELAPTFTGTIGELADTTATVAS